ncbi:MAG: 2-oxoacid:acceptor oxidoreductase subunit alpha [Phycisphaerae bacterium]|jgi:2-oxoglutarate ferredoxin oxidoreductase subunit alpha
MSVETKSDNEVSQSSLRMEELPGAAVRFAGDSGDGMQLAGTQFTNTSAVFGNDIATLPDYPAEIRAPAGTLAGVSGFQINFSSQRIHTPGDKVDALIAMNPAALKVNVGDLIEGGLLIVNSDEFNATNLQRAKFDANPLDPGSDLYRRFRVYKVPITTHTMEAVKATGLGARDAGRCKNFYALGVVFWLYDRPLDTTLRWIESKFAKVPAVLEANTLALKAGYNFGETAEIFPVRYKVERAKLDPGRYRNLTGNQAAALGLTTAAKLAGKPLFYGSYPITPASDILHELSMYKNFDVRTFQAEDEIAAMCAAIGASYAGALAATGTSGPGVALKQEGIGLAVMTELPVVIVNVQRGGPSTGLPTKTEQADLWQAVLGRNGECPVPVLAAQSPGDCFWACIEASRIAIKYMTPVFVLTDGYLANGSEPWRLPVASELKPIHVSHPTSADGFAPYRRDENGSRPWALPGTPGLMHRVGGLEKWDVTGHVSYDPDNHQRMIDLRQQKVDNIVRDVPDQEVYGDAQGELLLVSWGGTYGTVRTAVERARQRKLPVSHMHLRWLRPMPRNVGDILKRFRRIVCCELNKGQLAWLLRAAFLAPVETHYKVKGRPYMVSEITEVIDSILGGNHR